MVQPTDTSPRPDEDLKAQAGQSEGIQRAVLNILEDFASDRLRLEESQRAVLNILDDFNAEKSSIEATQKASFNILEDFNVEKSRLEETQRAVLNILEDTGFERRNLEKMQSATFNILDDFNAERLQMRDTPRALLNILDDLNSSNDELQKARDVLEIRVAERTSELKHRTDELSRSNAELEQFAYIASHDLQEPLRMISSYVQLLQRRYQGKLDADADEFINYAADGAFRMQRLINDLLAYSRVGTRGKAFEKVDLEAAFAQALENLQLVIKEKHATITHDPLPEAYGDSGQITQLFQNLIDNAMKFTSGKNPKIHVSASLENNECVCSVADNGIGIAPEYVSKIFLLFQRLHTKKDYPGTGIGLAICKRIAERHGGKIWVESQPEEGSTFRFTLPITQRSYYDG